MRSNFLRTLGTALVLGLGIGLGSQLKVPDHLTAKDADKAEQLPTLKMGVVNIAKVLKEFNSANQGGLAISKRRKEYFEMVKPMREQMAAISSNMKLVVDEKIKTKLQNETKDVNQKIEELERRAQTELAEMSDKIIVDVYQQIRAMVAEVGKEHGANIMVVYPEASEKMDQFKPAVAQLKLQTPAMTPFYLAPELDLTEIVIARLNQKYPAEKPKSLEESKP